MFSKNLLYLGVFSSESLQKFLVLNVFLLFLIIWKRKNIKRDNTTLNAEIVMRNCHLKKSGALNIVQGSINQKSHSFYVAQESFHKKLKFCSVKLDWANVCVCETVYVRNVIWFDIQSSFSKIPLLYNNKFTKLCWY